MITFAKIIQSENAQGTSQSKMDTQTVGYQNMLLRAVAQTDYTTGGPDVVCDLHTRQYRVRL